MASSTAPIAFLRALCVSTSLFCLVNARGKLPANFQVDLIFPQPNKTYTPTQYFPIVFGIQNAQKLWPLPFDITTEISDVNTPLLESEDWQLFDNSFTASEIGAAVERWPGNLYYHILMVNMTNATTSTYSLEWLNVFSNQCREKEEELKKNGSDNLPDGVDGLSRDIWIHDPTSYRHRIRHEIKFSTAPDGEVPDISAAAQACQQFEDGTTDVVRITDVISRRGVCPFYETDFPGTNCNYRPVADEVASNASTLLLSAMNCKDGDWRNITVPCNRAAGLSAQITTLSIVVPVALAILLK